MLGISSEARFTENICANFVACSAASLELYNFISFCLTVVRPIHLGALIQNKFFFICYCEFYSGKDSTKINKNKVKCLPTLIKSFVLKHGSHVNLKITVLKINNSNAHVGSTFCEGKLL